MEDITNGKTKMEHVAGGIIQMKKQGEILEIEKCGGDITTSF